MNDKKTRQGLEDWITTAAAAKMLGKTQRRIHQLVIEEKLVGNRVSPRLWLVSKQSVEDYIKEQ